MRKQDNNLEERIQYITKNNPNIAKALEQDPNLRATLVSSYERAARNGKGLLYAGKFIDKVNKPLALVKLAGAWAGPGLGYIINFFVKAGQLLLMKLPYSIYYAAKGGDKKALAGVGAFEAVKYFAPFGDAGDLVPVYAKAANKYIDDETAKYFLKAVEKKPAGKILDLETARRLKAKSIDDVLVEPAEIKKAA